MIQNLTIYENEKVPLDTEYLNLVKKIKLNDVSLPFVIDGNSLKFNSYIVGELCLGSLKITIKPRNPSFNLGVIFEMAAFTKSTFIDINIPGFSYAQTYGISAVSENFYKVIKLLLQNGLTGAFYKKRDNSKLIKGSLILESFHKKNIGINGIDYFLHSYSINIAANRLIKAAIKKLILVMNNPLRISDLHIILRDFDEISELNEGIDQAILDVKHFHSSNPYYNVAIECAIIILKDLKVSHQDGELSWYSFLENSNTLFENYILKTLRLSLPNHVEKWKEPLKFATIEADQIIGNKYYIPDILIEYDQNKNTALAIFDVKNKSFFPDKTELSQLVSSADIYQLLFYCRRLKTKTGGLIYPTDSDHDPIKLVVDDDQELNLFLISVNMKDTFEVRKSKLKDKMASILSYA